MKLATQKTGKQITRTINGKPVSAGQYNQMLGQIKIWMRGGCAFLRKESATENGKLLDFKLTDCEMSFTDLDGRQWIAW